MSIRLFVHWRHFLKKICLNDVNAGASVNPMTDYIAVRELENKTNNGDFVASFIGCKEKYYDGSYELEIPLYWYVLNGGPHHQLANNLQKIWVYSTGNMRIKKNAVTWERRVDGLEYVVEE